MNNDNKRLFHVKIIGLSSLESHLPFLISSLAHLYPPSEPTSLHPLPSTRVCLLPMPRHRESLDSVKERLVREQKVEQTEEYEICYTQDRGIKTLRFPTTVKKRTDLGYGEEDETRIRQPRLTVRLLFHFVVVCL